MSMAATMCCRSNSSPPPWHVVVLLAGHLDPETLAMASCVCKSWFLCMSSDHLWKPICNSQFPSLSSLQVHAADSAVSYRHLYALARISARRRLQKPPKPRLSLANLIFTIDVHNEDDSCIFNVVKPGAELNTDADGVFRFDIDVDDENLWAVEDLDVLKITWNMVLEGFKGMFTMMDYCKGKGSFLPRTDGWFSAELPSPGCCSSLSGSGFAADLRLGLRRKGGKGGKMTVAMVGVGVLSVVSWRYVSIEDSMRYLEHFLLPL
ncbi:probable F-box protein At5g04010 [Diospyros lotus]|uniref:probable F-box protein At5g04010 n=1 Tax=Diospyros lotus TaxID=55363 RepID=UPI002259A803|nr:probable F-box protein At5g04010 [Diospyros lotus]